MATWPRRATRWPRRTACTREDAEAVRRWCNASPCSGRSATARSFVSGRTASASRRSRHWTAELRPARSVRLLAVLLEPVQQAALDQDLALLRREVVRDLERVAAVGLHRDLIGAVRQLLPD